MGLGDGSQLSRKELRLVNALEDILFYLKQWPARYFTLGEQWIIFNFLLEQDKRVPTHGEIKELKKLKLRCVNRKREEDKARESIDKALEELGNRSSY